MMELQITSMTPAERLYATARAASLKGKSAVSATCAVTLAQVKSFLPHGSSTVGSIKPTSSNRSLMKWSTAYGRKRGCFSAGTA